MLLRFYRLTDKFGLILLKLSVAFVDSLLDSANSLIQLLSGSVGVVLQILIGILTTIFSGFLWLLKAIGRGFVMVARLLGVFGVRTVKASGSATQTGVRTASNAMARRAARDEIDVIVREDPLLVQNRRLSALVLFLGVLVVVAVLWATDPNRTNNNLTIAGNTNLLAPVTANPTEGSGIAESIPTPIPTATDIPDALRPRGSLVYTVREAGQTDLWAVGVGSRNAVRITNSAGDERDPAWNMDGTRLAYASRQDGNWELYIYDFAFPEPSRITFDLGFQANPSWSPDNLWLAYENYQADNLDIYAYPIDGSASPQRITDHPAPDFSPAWSPSGREIAFVSWRDGNQDIYVVSLDDPSLITNITNSPLINEDSPVWSPDGRSIAYEAIEQGSEKVFVRSRDNLASPPTVIAFGRAPIWSPDGVSIAFAVESTDGTRADISAILFGDGGLPSQIISVPPSATGLAWSQQPLPAQVVSSGGLPLGVSDTLYSEDLTVFDGATYRLQSLGDVQTNSSLLSDRVEDSFIALRQAVLSATNVDFLGQLDDAYWSLDRRLEPGESRPNWHYTGRAVAITRSSILGFPPPIEIVYDEQGVETYWRVYLRADSLSQSGQLGEPLRRMPWDFLSATEGGVTAFNQGGQLRRAVPSGYYVDLTQMAEDYGWQRFPASSDWRANERGRNYWLFANTDQLTWCQAMLEIYTPDQIANYGCETGQ